ncbi:unnamed protein product, partial [marine sediment metagenome]
MVLNKYRSAADPLLSAISKHFLGVHPNTLSAIAILCAIAAGFTIWAAGEYNDNLLLLAFLFIVLNSLFDALDGWVARYTGLASKQGDLVDHVLDRYADVFIFGGITFSAYCHYGVGIIGMMGVFFTSYMGDPGHGARPRSQLRGDTGPCRPSCAPLLGLARPVGM